MRAAFESAGLCCDCVTGGGTGTFLLDAETRVFTELQPGSYVFNDCDYSRNLVEDGAEAWMDPWVPSLFLLTQVMSVREAPTGGIGSNRWAVLDSGLKAQSTDSGPPMIVCATSDVRTTTRGDNPSIASCAAWNAKLRCFESSSRYGQYAVASVSDEHTKIIARENCADAPPLPAVGAKLLLMPGHCDPFVNHFDWLVAVENGVVAAVWRVGARSPGS